MTLLKNVKYSQNAQEQASSTIHKLTRGARDSMKKKLENIGSPITKGNYVAKAVGQLQRWNNTIYTISRTKHDQAHETVQQYLSNVDIFEGDIHIIHKTGKT